MGDSKGYVLQLREISSSFSSNIFYLSFLVFLVAEMPHYCNTVTFAFRAASGKEAVISRDSFPSTSERLSKHIDNTTVHCQLSRSDSGRTVVLQLYIEGHALPGSPVRVLRLKAHPFEPSSAVTILVHTGSSMIITAPQLVSVRFFIFFGRGCCTICSRSVVTWPRACLCL